VRPRIGITTALEGDEQRLDRRYERSVRRAGGVPVPVPFLESEDEATEFAALLEGLVVIGGPGVTRGMIGDLAPELTPVSEVRGLSDALILDLFLKAGRPVLGICYGMQLANVLLGGTLWGDVQRQAPGANAHSERRGATSHDTRVLPGTHLRRILETDSLHVPTHHLQAVRTLGDGLTTSAVAPDGVVEGIETATGRFVGVQFHPERMGDEVASLFGHLVRLAGGNSAERPESRAA
jgi:putative glutamine amidotransferase